MTTLEDVYLKLEVEAEIDQAGGKDQGCSLRSPQLWDCHCQEEGTRKKTLTRCCSSILWWKYSWKPGEGSELGGEKLFTYEFFIQQAHV